MSTEVPGDQPPRIPLYFRLAEMGPERDETRAGFMGRCATLAELYADEIVPVERFVFFRNYLDKWHVSEASVEGVPFAVARRQVPEGLQVDVDQEKSDRGLITRNQSGIIILARFAFLGEDVSQIYQIEGRVEPDWDPKAPPTFGHKRKRVQGTETAKWEPGKSLVITDSDREALRRLAHDPNETADELDISREALTYRMARARESNGLPTKELIRAAVLTGLVDTSHLPEEKPVLEESELICLKLLMEPLSQTTTEYGLRRARVIAYRNKLYKKLGAKSQNQAYAIALHYGLID